MHHWFCSGKKRRVDSEYCEVTECEIANGVAKLLHRERSLADLRLFESCVEYEDVIN